MLEILLPHRQPHVELSVFDNPVLAERLTDTIRPGLAGRTAFLVDAPDRTRGRGYYTGFALRITADQGETELGDGNARPVAGMSRGSSRSVMASRNSSP